MTDVERHVPRLVLRFAVCTCVAMALAAGAILMVVRHLVTVQAEQAATAQARVLAGAALRGQLRRSDFQRPVDGGREQQLDRLFSGDLLRQGVLLVELYTPRGEVSYSTDHRLIGHTPTGALGLAPGWTSTTVRGDATTLPAGTAGRTGSVRTLRTFAPVAVPGGTGVVGIFQDYGPISRAASATLLPTTGVFEAALVLLFLALVPLLRRVTVRLRRQMQEIEHRALHDELTGLPNRALFRDRVDQAILGACREGGSVTVMFLDVDHFKEINDALGHGTGDRLLARLAARLRSELRANETLARLGGDEFGILCTGTVEDARMVGERLHAALHEPFVVEDVPLEVSASIGMAAFPQHGDDLESLLSHSDVAMYLAKEARAGTAVYDPALDTSDAERLKLAGELRRAVTGDELVLHFQPKADLQSGRIVGVEALVRWQHPEHGLMLPEQFIPIAEQTGLIKPLSRYVLDAALRQCRAWRAHGLDLHVAVNLTIPDLLDLELPDLVCGLLEEHGIPADHLELEITESMILADPFRVRQVLTRLNELGLRLAIDDFGTGYSSLAYLKRLPVQTIKIDRSFVIDMCRNSSDATIVRSTIELARNLGLQVVAEGVESQGAWDELRTQGCTLAQGFLIGRPMEAEAILRLTRTHPEQLLVAVDGQGQRSRVASADAVAARARR